MTRSRFRALILVPGALLVIATVGFHFLEGWPWPDAFYASAMTLATVGYGDFVPVTFAGRMFTVILVLGGVFTLFYAASETIRLVVSGEIQEQRRRLQMQRELEQLDRHLIVCGFGRMGRLVCHEFAKMSLPFVLIERDQALLEDFQMAGGIPLHGDATSDDVLKRAGIDRARALVTVAASDADNLYITMSARLLNEKLYIVARASEPGSDQKLLRAGANRVVSPYQIGGARVAQAVLRPTVVDFIELATKTEHFDLQIEETCIAAHSQLAGKTLQDTNLRRELGIIIVAVKKTSGKMLFNPAHDAVLEPGDILIAIGDREHLDRLDQMAGG